MTNTRIILTTILALVINGVSYTANAKEKGLEGLSQYTVAEATNDFNAYMATKARRFSKKHDEALGMFKKVTDMFEASNGKFQNLNEVEKAKFRNSVELITDKLSSMRGEEPKMWLKKVKLSASIYEFVWSSKVMNDTKDIKIPTVEYTRPIGR